jgi:acyl-CoA thioesterase FadM
MNPQILTYNKKVNFGDVSFGQLFHFTKFFDLMVKVMEKMSHKLHYPIEMLVEEGNIPFATVTTNGYIRTYPRYLDTIQVESVPLEVGTRSFLLEIKFLNTKGGDLYGTVETVHTVIDSSGSAVELPQYVQYQLTDWLERRADTGLSQQKDNPPTENQTRGTSDFQTEKTVFSPQLEAAAALYYEDHFRYMTEALESHLLDADSTLIGVSEDYYPFKPIDWNVQFNESSSYGERIQLKGWITEFNSESVSIVYEISNDDMVKLAAAITYGCFNSTGDQIEFSDDTIAPLES